MPGGNGKEADRDVHLSPDDLWHVTGRDAANNRQDAYKEVTIARSHILCGRAMSFGGG